MNVLVLVTRREHFRCRVGSISQLRRLEIGRVYDNHFDRRAAGHRARNEHHCGHAAIRQERQPIDQLLVGDDSMGAEWDKAARADERERPLESQTFRSCGRHADNSVSALRDGSALSRAVAWADDAMRASTTISLASNCVFVVMTGIHARGEMGPCPKGRPPSQSRSPDAIMYCQSHSFSMGATPRNYKVIHP